MPTKNEVTLDDIDFGSPDDLIVEGFNFDEEIDFNTLPEKIVYDLWRPGRYKGFIERQEEGITKESLKPKATLVVKLTNSESGKSRNYWKTYVLDPENIGAYRQMLIRILGREEASKKASIKQYGEELTGKPVVGQVGIQMQKTQEGTSEKRNSLENLFADSNTDMDPFLVS